MTDNQTITEWLGECWHDKKSRPHISQRPYYENCSQCGRDMSDNYKNPNYSTPEGFVKLMKGLLERKDFYTIGLERIKNEYHCLIIGNLVFTGRAPTPELALKQATLKLIEGEG